MSNLKILAPAYIFDERTKKQAVTTRMKFPALTILEVASFYN
jgi:hypothetical protein